MIKDLIQIKQLPVIEEQLKQVSLKLDEKMKDIDKLVCTEESIQILKKKRTEFNKELKQYEIQRKDVKEKVLKPYNEFENVYKRYIADKFRNTDLILKGKIEVFEKEQKDKKEQQIKDYFEEYKTANNTDFIKYEQAKINVTLSVSMKSLKEQAKAFIDKIVDDLKLIDTQEHKTEILVEYKQTLNVSNAITSVANRFKAIEEEKKRQEEQEKLHNFIVEQAKESDKYAEQNELQVPVEEKQEEILTLNFKVKGTRTKLKLLKEFLENGGYDYE